MTGRSGRYAVVGFGIFAALWIIGLIVFVSEIKSLREPHLAADLEAADAIVVLTGGSERVSAGLELLEAGKGKKLFISGVHPGLTLKQLLDSVAAAKKKHDARVVLGYTAETTIGNAEETEGWMKLEGYHSLRLVTANYHMPRSLMVFRAMMPEAEIIPHPITPDHVVLTNWWQHPGTASLLVTESNTYLWAALRLQLGVL